MATSIDDNAADGKSGKSLGWLLIIRCTSLYERLALSRDKNDVMRLANEGAVPKNRKIFYIRHMY